MTRRTRSTDPRIADGLHRAHAARIAGRVVLIALLLVGLALVGAGYMALGGAR